MQCTRGHRHAWWRAREPRAIDRGPSGYQRHVGWSGSYGVAMPELSRFYGIIIRMYCEVGPHHSPHFHAYHGDDEATRSHRVARR